MRAGSTDPLWGLLEGLWLLPGASPARNIFTRLPSNLSLFTRAGNPVHASKDGPEWKTTFFDLQSTTFIFGTTAHLACHVSPEQPCSPLCPLVSLSGDRSSSSNPPTRCEERKL